MSGWRLMAAGLLSAAAVAAASAVSAASAPHAPQPSATVYPSGASVPENLLRIELGFSAPLNSPLAIEHVKLFDDHGQGITDAFLDVALPADDGRRLTILMHPGRVKSGVGANLVLGRALHAGSDITLVIDDPALARPVRKTWQVTAFNATPPQPARWTFQRPRAGSRDPLVLHLDAPITLSAQSLIAVRAPDGGRLAGEGHLENGEMEWRFVPAQRWHQGWYAILTHPDLEDPAGNRSCGAFEATAASQVRCDEGTTREFEPQ